MAIRIVGTEADLEPERPVRKTSPYMTRYEYTQLLAARTLQLASGTASPTVDTEGIHDAAQIARLEIANRTIPLVIQRKLPDGTVETWHIRDMHIRDS